MSVMLDVCDQFKGLTCRWLSCIDKCRGKDELRDEVEYGGVETKLMHFLAYNIEIRGNKLLIHVSLA